MTPKTGQLFAWKPNAMGSVTIRPNNSAGLLQSTVLKESAAFDLVWRMRVYARERNLAAAKPLWFLKSPLTLQAGQYKRLA